MSFSFEPARPTAIKKQIPQFLANWYLFEELAFMY
jgi:hypothetical protein